jgi:hypothetical protein
VRVATAAAVISMVLDSGPTEYLAGGSEDRVEHQRGDRALASCDRRQPRYLRIRHHLRNQICPDPHSSEKVSTAELPPLGVEFLAGVRELYDRELRAQINDRW